MLIFRNHKIKISLSILVIFSMLPFLFYSGTSSASDEVVTNWLNTYLKDQDSEHVKAKLQDLGNTHQDAKLVLKDASRIISEHADHFEIPVDSDDATDDDIYEFLMYEWAEYQQSSSSMGSSATLERTKQIGFQLEKYYRATLDLIKEASDTTYSAIELVSDTVLLIRHHILPLIGGVAIGAP